VQDRKKSVDRRGKSRKSQLPKVRVKVEKQAFDKVLGKLIQTKPQKRKQEVSSDREKLIRPQK
jgi:hypothetical protein